MLHRAALTKEILLEVLSQQGVAVNDVWSSVEEVPSPSLDV